MPPAAAADASAGLRPTAAAAASTTTTSRPTASAPPSSSSKNPSFFANLKSIDWRSARSRLPWLQLLVVVFSTGVALIVLEAAGKPRQRPYDVYDASISYSYHKDTVPSAVAFFVPVAAWLLTVLAVEFASAAAKAKEGATAPAAAFTAAATAALYHTFDVVCCLLVTALVTEATKLGVGRLRPYFLSACTPTEAATTGAGAAATKPSIGDARPPCDPVAGLSQRNARVSYPSGHSSTSMCTCAFAAFYVVWAVVMREGDGRTGSGVRGGGEKNSSSSSNGGDADADANDREKGTKASSSSPSWTRTSDFLRFVALLWALVLVGSPWVIGASRITDNRHHPSDVVAGLGLGFVVGGFFFARSIGGRRALPEYEESGERGGDGGGGSKKSVRKSSEAEALV